jgi:hypothetical protein
VASRPLFFQWLQGALAGADVRGTVSILLTDGAGNQVVHRYGNALVAEYNFPELHSQVSNPLSELVVVWPETHQAPAAR